MKILIFISKKIGLKFTKILFEKFSEDDYLFVISDPESKEIINELNDKKCKFVKFNKTTIKDISKYENKYFDWLLNLWGSQILSKDILDKARASLSIHPSYLPYGRGSDPIVWAIRNNHPVGATLHEISSKVDEGDIIFQERLSYQFPITGSELYEQVIKLCWKIFYQQWPLIRNGNYRKIKQKKLKDNKTNLRKNLFIDNEINLNEKKDYFSFLNHILAHDFNKNFSLKVVYNDKKYDIKLKINEIKPVK